MAAWGAQMWAYKNAFELPADHPERHRERVHLDYSLRADAFLGCGTPPSQRLQRRLRRPHHLSVLDKALTLFYLTWEIEPHMVVALIRHTHADRFAAAAGRLGAAYDLTLLSYWALPTAPPWWSSEKAGRDEVDARLGVAGWVYALTLGFALVYLGEHYVTDLLAGLALTLAVNQACLPLERLARAVLRPDD